MTPPKPQVPTAHDHLAIQNTLSRYCIALDTKELDLLDSVFVPDVLANYPFNPNLRGAEDVKRAVKDRCVLDCVKFL